MFCELSVPLSQRRTKKVNSSGSFVKYLDLSTTCGRERSTILAFVKYLASEPRGLWCFHTRARQRQDNDKTNVEPVHYYDAFHTKSDMSGVKGTIGMHRFNSCLVVVLSLSCSGVKTPLQKGPQLFN